MPFLPRPLGITSPTSVASPRLVFPSRYGARAQEEPRSRALGFPVPCPHCCDGAGCYYWVIVAPLPGSLGAAGRGGAQGCECCGRTGRSPPAPAERPRVGPGLRRRLGAPPALRPAGARADPAGNPGAGRPRGGVAPSATPVPCGMSRAAGPVRVRGETRCEYSLRLIPKVQGFPPLASSRPKIGSSFLIGCLLLLLVRSWG